jgi:hypothetical protein
VSGWFYRPGAVMRGTQSGQLSQIHVRKTGAPTWGVKTGTTSAGRLRLACSCAWKASHCASHASCFRVGNTCPRPSQMLPVWVSE